jgi:hypothetical protein
MQCAVVVWEGDVHLFLGSLCRARFLRRSFPRFKLFALENFARATESQLNKLPCELFILKAKKEE